MLLLKFVQNLQNNHSFFSVCFELIYVEYLLSVFLIVFMVNNKIIMIFIQLIYQDNVLVFISQ